MEPQTIQFVGAPCGHHGPYTFYKAFKFSMNGKYRILTLGEFFFVKISENAPVAIGELQLLWEDKNNESVYMTSVRLYFLPEHTPEGRQEYHGEDEILAESDKIVLRLEDLCRWIIDHIDWPIGSKAVSDDEISDEPDNANLTKLFATNNCGLELQDVKKEKQLISEEDAARPTNVTILSYSRYCRYRGIMKRLENESNSWLKNALVTAIGGFTAPVSGTRVVFCRDTFDHPDLASHDFRQDHLAPNLKGRPRKKKFKFKKDMESDSNDSDFTPGKEERCAVKQKEMGDQKIRRKVLRPNKDKVTEDEQRFMANLMSFMKRRKTPIDRIPSLGFKQIDLYYFYNYAQKLGGYEQITQRRMWKHLYDKLGGNPGSTSAATCTRRHYERLLLSFERYQKGEKDITPPPEDPANDIDYNGTDDSNGNEQEDSDNGFSNNSPESEPVDLEPAPKVDKASVNPKTVLAEQSPNHITASSVEAAPGARGKDSKENGIIILDSPSPVVRPPPSLQGAMQREPNMVMVVSKNGDIVRANHRSGPSIMTSMNKRPNVPPRTAPQQLSGSTPFSHKPQQLVVQPPVYRQSHQHPVRPGFTHGGSYHQKGGHPTQALNTGLQNNHMLPHQQLQPQHQQQQHQQQQQQQHQQHRQQHQHQHQHQHTPSGLPKGSLRLPNGPGRYLGEVGHRVPAAHSVGAVPDPNRPTVIQHTQVRPEIRTPPPSRHAIYGPPLKFSLPSASVTSSSPSSKSPLPLSQSGLKRGYPFQSNSPHPEIPSNMPPSAHNSRQNPSVYFRDLDPYANSSKRPHLHQQHQQQQPQLQHQQHQQQRGINSAMLGLLPNAGHMVVPKVSQEDEPTDLSLKKPAASSQPWNLESTSYHHHSNTQQLNAAADEGPLNLVVHKRSRDDQPNTNPMRSSTLSSTSGGGLVSSDGKGLLTMNNSQMALPFDNNPAKVPKDLSSSMMHKTSPRTFLPQGGAPHHVLPPPHSPHSTLRPSTNSPRPPSRPSSKASPHTPGAHTGTTSPLDRTWATPQGAKPVTASPDFGAASIHPAFPQLAPHIMPGLLPPAIPPQVLYEASLRATQSVSAGATPTTTQTLAQPPTQVVISAGQSPVEYRK